MWRFKQFIPKEQPGGLEGRTVDVGNVKVHVREAIAEGGFSCVYAARDMVNPTKQYALKHVIVQDEESLELVRKEITVMRSLKGHPNVVTLVAHAIHGMDRTREALLVMEFCEKSLVSVLEGRGAGYYDEEKVALIFRDVCNAVFAMHCQTPPLAHRDLKAENVLLGTDGAWKLCDFGSVSTNHKCFDKPEEMGIEEDNIRKHTTPAYRAPEMWDLYRREVISEKVDIWVWFRVNELLPLELQRDLPDGSPSGSAFESHTAIDEAPRRPPQGSAASSSKEDTSNLIPQGPPKAMENRGPMGAFWSTQHAQELAFADDKGPAFDQEPVSQVTSKQSQAKNQNTPVHNSSRKSLSASVDSSPGDFEIRFSANGSESGLEKTKTAKTETKTSIQATTFNSFVADFDNKMNSQNNADNVNIISKLKECQLEAEVTLLKEQLKIANLEKEEISLKFDKLSAICSSQRREIQELKQALATASVTPPAKQLRENSKVELSPPSTSLDTPPREKIEGTPPELRQGLFTSSPGTPSPDPKPGSAFPEEPKPQAAVKSAHPRSVRTLRASNSNKASSLGQATVSSSADPFAFGQDSFKAAPSGTILPKLSNMGNTKPLNNQNAEEKKDGSYQPAGWTGF
ncbi:putative serine/threonine-protein kinase [Dichanthelium oligosanthes]|uniref:Putative serine/threonine-protein kinase n=1 Tax=Dichanthelium oligosanthes TaxID=888268 RepID=A0A1E5UW94_9POAL|nr:putative serine/threonine-protein kinase [Dichanthelium oligosanthes]